MTTPVDIEGFILHLYGTFNIFLDPLRLLRRKQSLLLEQLLQLLSGDDRAHSICCTIPPVEFSLGGDGIVDVIAAHAILASVLAPHLCLLG